jgi:hemerythrin
MWQAVFSTGIPEIDAGHAHLDAVIAALVGANSAVDEHNQLMDVYCAIISHMQFKNDFIDRSGDGNSKELDIQFLKKVREKIRQRDDGMITRRQLVNELRSMLMVHAMGMKTSPKATESSHVLVPLTKAVNA